MTKASDHQEGGDHHKDFPVQMGIACQRNGLRHFDSEAIVHISRHLLKDGKLDLLKARHYIDLIIELDYPESTEQSPLSLLDRIELHTQLIRDELRPGESLAVRDLAKKIGFDEDSIRFLTTQSPVMEWSVATDRVRNVCDTAADIQDASTTTVVEDEIRKSSATKSETSDEACEMETDEEPVECQDGATDPADSHDAGRPVEEVIAEHLVGHMRCAHESLLSFGEIEKLFPFTPRSILLTSIEQSAELRYSELVGHVFLSPH